MIRWSRASSATTTLSTAAMRLAMDAPVSSSEVTGMRSVADTVPAITTLPTTIAENAPTSADPMRLICAPLTSCLS